MKDINNQNNHDEIDNTKSNANIIKNKTNEVINKKAIKIKL